MSSRTPDPAVFDRAVRILSRAIGRDRAITIAQLVDLLELPNRRAVEQLIETRLSDFPFPIVSGSAGVYRPDSVDDLNAYRANLTSRMRAIRLRIDTVTQAALNEGWLIEANAFVAAPQQLSLQL